LEPGNGEAIFQSALPFEEERPGAAAVYCGDGRFAEQMDDFLCHALGLPRCDRFVIPGGPACFAGHFCAYREEEASVEHLRFLVQAHELRRVVLIAHQACAYYSQKLNISPYQIEQQQHDDLLKAARRVSSFSHYVAVEAYFASLQNGRVCFKAVKV
jgi:hypothetical protein